MEKKSADLVIVYDKYTEKVANGISGKLAGKYTCLVQKDTVFKSNKNSYTNNNRILFLVEDLIFDYLSMGEKTEYVIEDEGIVSYTFLYSLGNWRGIWVDKEKSIKALPKNDKIYYYFTKFYTDIAGYPFVRRRLSKDIESLFYKIAADFFFKNENIKLIIPD